MKKAIALILCMMMLLSMVACKAEPTSEGAQTTGTQGTAQTEASGENTEALLDEGLSFINDIMEVDYTGLESTKKELVYAQSKDPGSLLPYKCSPSIYATASWTMCERLAVLDEFGEMQPVLAESWSYSDDGMTFTFKLKEGIYYTNGEEMVAEDIVGIMKNYMSTSSFASSTTGYVDYSTMKAVDKYTVSVGLKYKCAYANTILTKCCAIPLSLQEEMGDNLGVDKIIGTGAYMLDEYVAGDHLTMVPNPNYWDKEHQPQLEKITVRFISEPSVALIEMENGNVDFIFDPTATEYHQVENGDGSAIAWQCPSLAGQTIFFNCTGVLSDIRLRKAICYAIDNTTVNLLVFDGLGAPATSIFPSGLWAYSQKMGEEDIYAVDRDKAKALLAEAGYPNGLTLSMICASSGTHKNISEVLINQLAEVGITLDVEYADSTTANSLSQDTADYDIAIRQAGFTDSFFYSKYLISTNGNPLGGTNLSKNAGLPEAEALDAIINQIIEETDRDKLMQIYEDFQIGYYDQAYGYALQDNVDIYVFKSNLKGVVRTSGYLLLTYAYFD